MQSPLIQELIDALTCLPGVGPKSAQRMTMQLLERNREGANRLSSALTEAMDKVGHCRQCRNFSESELCPICSQLSRDSSLLCIVESPADLLAIEQVAEYRGRYFVLMGHLSPLDGIGPDEIGISQLMQQVKSGEVKEVILATNPTIEGEATAHYIAEAVKPFVVHTTRIAHGVPMGGELEMVDSNTLAHALAGRQAII